MEINKCINCAHFNPDTYGDMVGWGDCQNPIVRGESGLIKLVYCAEFYISENFGCVFFKAKKEVA